jgi:ornithine cyclodeaminase
MNQVTKKNGNSVTELFYYIGSGLATRYYANPKAKNLVVFGAGAQGRSHVDMMIAVRPSLQRISIWNRGETRRLQLIEELKKAYPDRTFVSANEELEKQVRDADIICTCTNATDPVLFGEWLKPGVHLNCVGSYRMDMHEVDAETVKRAELIVVDSVNACSHEAGELVKSSKSDKWLEMGDITLKNIKTEDDRNKTTLFKSVGISVQDSAISGLMVELAKKANLGTSVPF